VSDLAGVYSKVGILSDPVGVLYTTEINFVSRAHYIGACGGVYCPLIKGLPPIRT
jgi:hypothetical protein